MSLQLKLFLWIVRKDGGLVVGNESVQRRSTKTLAFWILVLFRQTVYSDYSALPGQAVLGLCRGTFRQLSQRVQTASELCSSWVGVFRNSFGLQFLITSFNIFCSLALQLNLIKTILKVFPHQQFHFQKHLQLRLQILSLFYVFLLWWPKEELVVHK